MKLNVNRRPYPQLLDACRKLAARFSTKPDFHSPSEAFHPSELRLLDLLNGIERGRVEFGAVGLSG